MLLRPFEECVIERGVMGQPHYIRINNYEIKNKSITITTDNAKVYYFKFDDIINNNGKFVKLRNSLNEELFILKEKL